MSLNLIKHQQADIDKIYLYVKDPFESKCQLLINGREEVGIKKIKNPKAFIDYPQRIDDVYKNLLDHNPTKKGKVLIVFDDMIADMEANNKLSPIFAIFTNSNHIVLKKQKAQPFASFYITILF